MKTCVQWDPVHGKQDLRLEQGSNPGRYISRTALNLLSYRGSSIILIRKRIFDTDIVIDLLSYDGAVIQWLTSCNKNRMTTCVLTLWCVHVTSLTTSASTMCFLIEIMIIVKAIKYLLKESYDKQNLTLVLM